MSNAVLYTQYQERKYMFDPDICCIDSGSDLFNLSCVACKKGSQYVGWMKT